MHIVVHLRHTQNTGTKKQRLCVLCVVCRGVAVGFFSFFTLLVGVFVSLSVLVVDFSHEI